MKFKWFKAPEGEVVKHYDGDTSPVLFELFLMEPVKTKVGFVWKMSLSSSYDYVVWAVPQFSFGPYHIFSHSNVNVAKQQGSVLFKKHFDEMRRLFP